MTLPIPHKEHFEHWLMSQPDDAGWIYTDCANCVGATFIRDIYKVATMWGTANWALATFKAGGAIPDWLRDVIHKAQVGATEQRYGQTYITVQNLRECWRKLNPEPPYPISQRCVAMGLTKTK